MDNEPLPDFADGVREGARFIADECAELLEVRDIFDWVGCCFLSLDNGYREVGGERIGGWHCEIAVMGAEGKATSSDWATAIIEAAKKAGWAPRPKVTT